MVAKTFPRIEDDSLKSSFTEHIAILKFKKNVFDFIVDQKKSEKMMSILESIEKLPDIRAILFINEPGSLDDTKYHEMYEQVTTEQGEQLQQYKIKALRTVAVNLLRRIINLIIHFKKITVCGLQGKVTTPFFGTSLAMDFRYAPGSMTFFLNHIKRRHYPSGALPFFLTQHLGRAQTLDILLSKTVIGADEALKLKLINRILPQESFEQHCITEIKKLPEVSLNTILATKQLLNYSCIDIEDYFQFEKQIKG